MKLARTPKLLRRGRTRMAAWACLFVALVAASGCTARQSHKQYEERLEGAVAVREDVTRRIDSGEVRTPAAHEQAADQLEAAAAELDADPPPKDAEAAHERMLAGLEGMAALVTRLGRCAALDATSRDEGRRCRRDIEQTVYDEMRNDFEEANTIYRENGFTLPDGGGAGTGSGTGPSGEDPLGGDEL